MIRKWRTAPGSIRNLVFGLTFVVLNAGCQAQTNSLELCESLQKQGGAVMDATCWVRGDLDPTSLVSPGVLVATTPHSTLADVLSAIQESKIAVQDGTEFTDAVSRFKIQCVKVPSGGDCAWTLTSRPEKAVREVFSKRLLDAIDWIQKDIAPSTPLKIALLNAQDDAKGLTIEIRGSDITISWTDTAARAPQ